jgi:hypothetical protein
MRQIMTKGINEREGSRAHRRWRIQRWRPSASAISDERFPGGSLISLRGSKGVRGRAPGAFIGGLGLEEKLGFALTRSTAGEESVQEEFLRWRTGMTCGVAMSEGDGVLTHGVHLSAGERGRGDTLSGLAPGGRWAALAARPNRFPSAFFYFFISFLFSVFSFYFYSFTNLFQIKPNQIKKNILIFNSKF